MTSSRWLSCTSTILTTKEKKTISNRKRNTIRKPEVTNPRSVPRDKLREVKQRQEQEQAGAAEVEAMQADADARHRSADAARARNRQQLIDLGLLKPAQ